MDSDNLNPNQNPIPTPPPDHNGSKMIIWLLGGLAIIALIVGAMYWYLSGQQKKAATVLKANPPSQVEDALEKDLNSIDAEASGESDFAPVDQDLQNL